MSEIETPAPDAATPPAAETPAAPAAPLTFGRKLAVERERQGLSIGDVASRLRLHPRQVQAIENEALPSLPAPFLRGFVRNYAKELRLDPEPLVAELSARLGGRPEQVVRATGSTASGSRLEPTQLASRRVVVGGALVALVSLAVLGWMATHGERRAAPSAPAPKPAEPAAPVSAVDQPAADKAVAQTVAATSIQSGDAAPATASSSATPAAATATTALAVPTATAAAAAMPTAAATGAATAAAFDGLRLSFREQSWVEVTQADGRIVHSQINAAGSEQRIEGKSPLKVVIGNASAVSVEFKSKTVDLKPVTSLDNVARLTLN